jgi:hypothetical protein
MTTVRGTAPSKLQVSLSAGSGLHVQRRKPHGFGLELRTHYVNAAVTERTSIQVPNSNVGK